MKRLSSILLIMMLIIGINLPIYSYADDVPSGYTPVTDDMETAQAFNDYCKSRDASFTSTKEGAVYTYLYNYMKDGLKYLGYNIDELQEGLYAQYDSLGNVSRWYWDSQSIGIANQLFAYLINENDLQVGEPADQVVYSGDVFTDDDGNHCLVFVLNSLSGTTLNAGLSDNRSSYILYYGSPLKYDNSTLVYSYENSITPIISVNESQKSFPLYRVKYSDTGSTGLGFSSSKSQIYRMFYAIDDGQYAENVVADGYISVCKLVNTEQYYLCTYTYSTYTGKSNGERKYNWDITRTNINPPSESLDKDINIYFVSTQINNNNYEGDTVINNNGDIINNDPVTPGGNDPGWNIGGGQGEATDGNGNTWNITFPDFELPDLNIDWSIQGLGEKFPFSIPFDIYNLFVILDHEPETPEISGQIDLGLYQWDIDWNLHQFDDTASLLRNIEFVGFVLGLILITRSIIRG